MPSHLYLRCHNQAGTDAVGASLLLHNANGISDLDALPFDDNAVSGSDPQLVEYRASSPGRVLRDGRKGFIGLALRDDVVRVRFLSLELDDRGSEDLAYSQTVSLTRVPSPPPTGTASVTWVVANQEHARVVVHDLLFLILERPGRLNVQQVRRLLHFEPESVSLPERVGVTFRGDAVEGPEGSVILGPEGAVVVEAEFLKNHANHSAYPVIIGRIGPEGSSRENSVKFAQAWQPSEALKGGE